MEFANYRVTANLIGSITSRWLALRCIIATILCVLSLSGCEPDLQLPSDAELTISPSARHVTIAELRNDEDACKFSHRFYQDSPVQIVLRSASGSAIGGAPVHVYVDYASNTYPSFPALALYADINGNGVVDSPDELVSGFNDDIYSSKTQDYSGEIMLLLRINLSCAFKGSVRAFSGGVYGSMEIEVVNSRVGE